MKVTRNGLVKKKVLAGAKPAPARTDHPGEVSGARILSFSISPPSSTLEAEEPDKRPTQELTVTGVIRDIPKNSTLRFDFLSALTLRLRNGNGTP